LPTIENKQDVDGRDKPGHDGVSTRRARFVAAFAGTSFFPLYAAALERREFCAISM
jgi:hypothetical protein